ncbi:MAG: hypothetical protein WC956_01670 [bacterium]
MKMHRALKAAAAVVLTTCFMTNISCTSWHDLPTQSAESLSSTPFDAQKKYEIVFTNGATITAKGSNLTSRGWDVGVRPEGQGDFVYYSRDQIQSIRVREFSGGKTAGLVAGIVAGIGAIVGGSIAAIHSACSTPNACN